MSIWKKLFGDDLKTVPSPSQHTSERAEDPNSLYQTAVEHFKNERFKDALNLFEKLTGIEPSSAQVYYMLGTTYTRLAGQLCTDDNSLLPWLRKSIAAFKRAANLARDRGGLTAEQFETASEAALHGERVIERHSPSVPEERRRQVYADFMETQDTEFLSDSSVTRGMAEGSRTLNLKMIQEAISNGGARAEAAALDKVMTRHNLTKGQLLAIKEEGREKNWPFKPAIKQPTFENWH
jgi:tetratricopeptide (TPR) repeat protein